MCAVNTIVLYTRAFFYLNLLPLACFCIVASRKRCHDNQQTADGDEPPSADPHSFYKFVDKLEKDSPMQHFCEKPRSTCGECDNVCQSTSTDQWCSGVAQLKSTQPVSSVTLLPNTSGEQRMCVWWNNM